MTAPLSDEVLADLLRSVGLWNESADRWARTHGVRPTSMGMDPATVATLVREVQRLRATLQRIANAKFDGGTYEGNFAWMWEAAAEALGAQWKPTATGGGAGRVEADGREACACGWRRSPVDGYGIHHSTFKMWKPESICGPVSELLGETAHREAKDLARDALAAEMKKNARLRTAIDTAGHALGMGSYDAAQAVPLKAAAGEDSPDAFASRLGPLHEPLRRGAEVDTTAPDGALLTHVRAEATGDVAASDESRCGACERPLAGWEEPACSGCSKDPAFCRCEPLP